MGDMLKTLKLCSLCWQKAETVEPQVNFLDVRHLTQVVSWQSGDLVPCHDDAVQLAIEIETLYVGNHYINVNKLYIVINAH